MNNDVHQANFATGLRKSLTFQDGQDRTALARCNVEGNATFSSSRRPKFGIIGVVLFVLCLPSYLRYLPLRECVVLVILGEATQVGAAIA